MSLDIDLDIDVALKNIHRLKPEDKAHVMRLLDERERLKKLEDAREHFLPFVKMMWPGFIPGPHHVLMAEAFERVARGELKRLIINMPPRHTKSELTSWLLPAWFLGKYPRKKIIQASNTEALAAGFGRRVRNLISGEAIEGDDDAIPVGFTDVFPGVHLAKDSQAAAGWHTNKGGEYFAIGISGKVTGKGGDIVIIDDPHSEQEARQAETSPEIFDGVYEWYTSGPRQRLQPGGAIIIVMTRWSKRDLTGQVLKKEAELEEGEFGDRWEVIEFPAILDEHSEEERSLWPAFWALDDLKATRAVLPVAKWKAQYQQQPTSEEGAIIKRENWRRWGSYDDDCPAEHLKTAWENLEPPPCEFIMVSIDTAMKKNERADYSAFTTWGVFKVDDPQTGLPINNIILLSAWKARLEFPELKKKVREFYLEDTPDTILIEDKGSGISLIQELRSMDIPVENFSYGRGTKGMSNDKVARANMVADIFASGYVWAPERRFADECIEECAEFPYGDHDDYVDSVVQALLRFRAGGFIRTANDADDDWDNPRPRRAKRYY
jgi:predicted phage terminase large subunit-like protein